MSTPGSEQQPIIAYFSLFNGPRELDFESRKPARIFSDLTHLTILERLTWLSIPHPVTHLGIFADPQAREPLLTIPIDDLAGQSIIMPGQNLMIRPTTPRQAQIESLLHETSDQWFHTRGNSDAWIDIETLAKIIDTQLPEN